MRPLDQRIALAAIKISRSNQRIEPKYRIVFEKPGRNGAVTIKSPAPEWLTMAMMGGVLPPIEAYLADKLDEANGKTEGPWQHWTAEPIGPLTEEQAMTYLVMKDCPIDVWAKRWNRPKFVIVPAEAVICRDRSHRNAWRMSDFIPQEGPNVATA